MEIKTFVSDFLGSNSYVANGTILIDPSIKYNDIMRHENFSLKAVFLTHGHIDHILNIDSYLKVDGLIFYMHKEAYIKLLDANKNLSSQTGKSIVYNIPLDRVKFINEHSKIEIDGINIKVLDTPGHSNCSICIIIDNIMFSGDMVFKGTVGRTDLYSANPSLMLSSIEKLKKLKTDYLVYPGHGDTTKLFLEKLNNPYF